VLHLFYAAIPSRSSAVPPARKEMVADPVDFYSRDLGGHYSVIIEFHARAIDVSKQIIVSVGAI
jgi:hypothetical protein